MLSKVSDIIHALFGSYKASFLPVFEKLLPAFVKLLVSIGLINWQSPKLRCSVPCTPSIYLI